MHFNSLEYLLFLPVIALAYFLLPHKQRWVLLLVASYFFYAFWRVEYAALIFFSTCIDFWAGLQMAKHTEQSKRKPYLYLSLLGNLGLLFSFKYLGFFNEVIRDLTGLFDVSYSVPEFNILLPIGISFYTFQSLSYTIDVYRGKKLPEKHFGIFALYVAFFPQLVAGPIERSTKLLPQLHKKHLPDLHRIAEGGKLILWGLFKKLVIADHIGVYVSQAYNAPESVQGGVWLLIAAGFSIQLYMDFSAYSDIAIGSARIFGIELTTNFDRPFQTTNIRDFWRKWHITLSDWLFEYVYRPLRRNRRWPLQITILVFFLIVGFWHGAGWGFLVFGFAHGIAYGLSKLISDKTRKKNSAPKQSPLFWVLAGMFWVFLFNSIAGIFFRADSVTDGFYAIEQIGAGFANWNFDVSALHFRGHHLFAIGTGLLIVYIMHNLKKFDAANPFSSIKLRAARWGLYYIIFFMLILFGQNSTEEFLYFQF